jgi:hypothetical protein
MMTDNSLQQAVLDELKWEPSVNAAHIGVTAKDGVVTLSGDVSSYTEKLAAARAARRVIGVKGVAEDIKVHYSFSKVDDTDIAQKALQTLSWDIEVPDSEELSTSICFPLCPSNSDIARYLRPFSNEQGTS